MHLAELLDQPVIRRWVGQDGRIGARDLAAPDRLSPETADLFHHAGTPELGHLALVPSVKQLVQELVRLVPTAGADDCLTVQRVIATGPCGGIAELDEELSRVRGREARSDVEQCRLIYSSHRRSRRVGADRVGSPAGTGQVAPEPNAAQGRRRNAVATRPSRLGITMAERCGDCRCR